MCDSITILVLLEKQSQKEYDGCNFPTRGKEDTDEASSDFRDQYPTSPLTGAGFRITPLGEKLASAGDVGPIEKNRMLYGRVAGYLVDFNPPACTVGHNRLLVNGVPFAARLGLAFLRHWLASNGCTRPGIDAAKIEGMVIISATPTFLFDFATEDEARIPLADFRSRSEALCNKKVKAGVKKKPAFSVPPAPLPHEPKYIYTSYIRQREYLIDCYVKVAGAHGSYCKAIPIASVEFEVEKISKRTLRIGTKLNGKWLKDENLQKVSEWVGGAAYEKAFALVRANLLLDEDLRTKQLRSPSVKNLNLPKNDQSLLRYHIAGNIAREHDLLRLLSTTKASKSYSASRLRIYERTKIDLNVPYAAQLKALFPHLADLLVYPGEYRAPDHVAPYIFSRISVPAALEKLEKLTEELLDSRVQDHDSGLHLARIRSAIKSSDVVAAGRPTYQRRGISNVPVNPSD